MSGLGRIPGSRFFWLLPLVSALLVACEGDNLFETPTGPGTGGGPSVLIQKPDSAQRVALGDSVFVQVRVGDDQGVARVELTGFALSGSAVLGTLTETPRFEPKVIDLEALEPVVRDTVLTRYLLSTGDSISSDTVLVVARAFDALGNESADTVRFAIGGPRVRIAGPSDGAAFRPGAQIAFRLAATDSSNLLQNVRLFTTGVLAIDTTLSLDPPPASVDTVIAVTVPASAAAGDVTVQAVARNAVNDTTAALPISIEILPPATDTEAPEVRFTSAAPARAEQDDSIRVTVVADDDFRVSEIGATFLAIHRLSTGTDTLASISRRVAADSATIGISLAELAVPVPTDTSTVRVEVTAFAIDGSGNCASATVPSAGTFYSDACVGSDPVFGIRPGARYEILVVRGESLTVGNTGDLIVDLAADGSNLFISNLTRNRVEVLPLDTRNFLSPISVGSRPWGLAFNADDSRLYVANSGGTNISVVSPTSRSEVDRIQTPNVKLFDVTIESALIEDPDSPGDTIPANFPTNVARFDYSDRPQFIGITTNENIIYSTRPTPAAQDGTVRIYRTDQERLQIVTEYAEETIADKVVIVNADSAFLVSSTPNNLLRVCPRNRSENPALDRNLPETCYTGNVGAVQSTISAAGYDTRFLYNLNINEVGLSDTTFVAVSRDHSTVAVGEGARTNGRVVAFEEDSAAGSVPLVKSGEIRDLVGNAAERVIGLALNADGSLGLARGTEAYFFSTNLRLQGFVDTDQGQGGVAMHPDNPSLQRAFVPGVQSNGLAFIDVVDSFHFRRIARIFVRDPIVGPIRAVRVPDGSLKIYAITESGILAVDVLSADL